MPIVPPFLSASDTIAVVAPSGAVQHHKVKEALSIITGRGYAVMEGNYLYDSHFKYASHDSNRLSDLQTALDHQDVRAIWCARGGYGLSRILSKLDFSQFLKNPKWVIGFSDITALHLKLSRHHLVSIHGPVVQQLPDCSVTALSKLWMMLEGNLPLYLEPFHKENITGEVTAPLVGGNLSLLVHAIGSDFMTEFDGKILFIEEVSEPLYHIDRMMVQLRNAGQLNKIKGVIIGHFSSITEEESLFGKNHVAIIKEHIPAGIPLVTNFPAGHMPDNYPLLLGWKVRLSVNNRGSMLQFLTDDHTSQ